MNNWKTYKLGDLAAVQTGPFGSQLHASDYVETGIPSIMPVNIVDHKVEEACIARIKPEDAKRLIKYLVASGDVVFSRRGEIHRRALITEKENGWLCGTGCLRARLRNTDEVDSQFLYFYIGLVEVRDWLYSHAVGTSMPNLNSSILSNLPVVLPDLPAQRRIAEILSALNDKIDLNRRMNQTLEQMAQTLFRQYFVDGIDEENLPEGWSKKSLGELVEITSSKRIFLNDYVPEGIPFYRGKEIIQLNKSGIISTELFITKEKFDTIKGKFGVPKEGDILLTSVGTIGVPYLVNKEDIFYFKDGNITWIKSYLNHIGPVYLYQWLISKEGQSSIDNITIGSTQKAVTIQSLKTMQVIVPPMQLHDSVCNHIQGLRDKINHNIKEIRTLIQTRDSLLL